MYKTLFRPILFKLDPEFVHELTLQALRLTGAVPFFHSIVRKNLDIQAKPVQAFGLTFKNPVGLAAGYDKDGLAWRGLTALGFGHLEVGTVTPRAQPGNPRPRLFRIPEEQAIINRMGFPGYGADFLVRRLQNRRQLSDCVLGVNIGKNKDTPNERAVDDYLMLLKTFAPLADYLTVNVSSPNTVGLRRLQAREYLEGLLKALAQARANMSDQPPILVKLAPDLNADELDDALGAIMATGMDGVIATNTTIRRDTLISPLGTEKGGLSGAPLTAISRNMVAEIRQRTQGQLPVVGVGGIMSPDDARAMLDAGACLVQIYTGLIYAGPGFVRQIVSKL